LLFDGPLVLKRRSPDAEGARGAAPEEDEEDESAARDDDAPAPETRPRGKASPLSILSALSLTDPR
jgi:hypothetical protein